MLTIVTGAAGFIGSHLVDRLLNMGGSVIGIDNLSLGGPENLKSALKTGRFRLIEADLSDTMAIKEKVHPAIKEAGKVDDVWHMAANSDIPAGVHDSRVDMRDTFRTTFETLRLMEAFKIPRLAFASTSAVYGEKPGKLTEGTGPLLPISNYGAMKLASEAIISAARESFLTQACMFRFPNVVGPRATHGVIFDLFNKLKRDPIQLEVLGNGTQQKLYLHVKELLDAMFYIWTNAADKIALYNIGPDDDGAQVRFIAETVVETSGTNATIHYGKEDRGWLGDVPRFSYSTERLRCLGWSPSHSSKDAISRAVVEIGAELGF